MHGCLRSPSLSPCLWGAQWGSYSGEKTSRTQGFPSQRRSTTWVRAGLPRRRRGRVWGEAGAQGNSLPFARQAPSTHSTSGSSWATSSCPLESCASPVEAPSRSLLMVCLTAGPNAQGSGMVVILLQGHLECITRFEVFSKHPSSERITTQKKSERSWQRGERTVVT